MNFKTLTLIALFGILTIAYTNTAETHDSIQMRDNQHLLWGHYKPHRLSVVTQRSPSPLSAGFMFSDELHAHASYPEFVSYFRDTLGLYKDYLSAEYIFNDGKRFSQQIIADRSLSLYYNLTFVKTHEESSSEQSWVYLIESYYPEKSPKWRSINTFAYIGGETLDGVGLNYFDLVHESERHYVFRATDFATKTMKGYFDVEIIPGKIIESFLSEEEKEETEVENAEETMNDKCKPQHIWTTEPLRATQCTPPKLEVFSCYMNVPPAEAWKQTEYIYLHMENDEEENFMRFNTAQCHEPDNLYNLIVFQVRGPYKYKIKITYHSESPPSYITVEETQQKLHGLTRLFMRKLNDVFPIMTHPGPVEEPPSQEQLNSWAKIRRTGVSNMIGGLCYTYGHILTKVDIGLETPTQPKLELFSSTPSRVTFPRGFLWDEGFHQLILCRWDKILCMEILESWFNTMSSTGWIPREQARGQEQESAFHEKKFLYQDEREANPPTLLLAVEYLMLSTNSSHLEYQNVVKFLNSDIEEKIKKWFEFFNATQRNFEIDNNPFFRGPLFRWTCVEPCEGGNVMGSGLDDYPRADPFQEPLASLDLQVWMIFMVKTINQIARYKGEEPNPVFLELESKLVVALEEFRDPDDGIYKDILQDAMGTDHGERRKIFNSHIGYVNLFPLFFGLIPVNSESWHTTVGLMVLPELLWSDYGIRSLSASDPYFLQGEKYWTEPIWMNINYLILRSLERYYTEDDAAREIYEIVRANLINTVTTNWKETYTFWENYSSITGKGQRSPAFYGWSTLIVLIMSDFY